MDFNRAIIVGRATANPELRKTAQGTSVTAFGVATNRVWNDASGSKREEVEFHNIVAWGRTAEIAAQYLTKGSIVLIEGRLQTRTWQDKQGANQKTTEIICERLQLGPKPSGAASSQGGGFAKQQQGAGGFSGEKDAPSSSPREDVPVIDMDGEEVPF